MTATVEIMPRKYEIAWHNYMVMIPRLVQSKVAQLLEEFPAVALLGPRQVGKTTLALSLTEALGDRWPPTTPATAAAAPAGAPEGAPGAVQVGGIPAA
jgi:hypothetical protein